MNPTPKRSASKQYFALIPLTVTLTASVALIGCQGMSSNNTSNSTPTTPQQQTTPGNLSASSSSISFGTVQTGNSQTENETVTNTGGENVTITQAPVTGSAFNLSGVSFPVTLAAGKSASFTIAFAPKATGGATGSISIVSNSSTPLPAISLSGTGTTAVGQLAVSPSSLAIGNVVVGTTGTASGSLTATGANVTITSASSSSAQFVLSGMSLPMTLFAGQSVPFKVAFSPNSSGASGATVTFISDADPSSAVDAVSGTGTSAPVHIVNLSWDASSSTDVVGYNIYRSVYSSGCGGYTKLNSSVNGSTTYGDSTVVDGSTYCYVTTAVNSSSQESAFSAPVEAAIPAP